jgi:hypothetical protein
MSPGVNRWHGKTRSADAIPAECLGSFLLRHNEIYREQTAWTAKHEEWIAHRHFADPAARSAFSFYRAAVAERDVTLSAITAELACGCRKLRPSD